MRTILRRAAALVPITLALSFSAQAEVTAFTGATLMPVSEQAIENGVLIIEDGSIVAVGSA